MALPVRGGEWGVAVDYRGGRRVAEQWAAPLGRLSRLDIRPVDCTGQESRNQTGRDWRNVETPAGQVPPAGVRAVSQGSLQDGAASRRSGGGY